MILRHTTVETRAENSECLSLTMDLVLQTHTVTKVKSIDVEVAMNYVRTVVNRLEYPLLLCVLALLFRRRSIS